MRRSRLAVSEPGRGAARQVVGVAAQVVVCNTSDILVGVAIGSCLAVTVWDPDARVAGMAHVMLPDSRLDAARAASAPSMFVDTAIPRLFREAYRAGAVKERIVLKVAGGAAVLQGRDLFEIGKRNVLALRKILWRNGVLIAAHDVGGTTSRTVELDAATGAVFVRRDGIARLL